LLSAADWPVAGCSERAGQVEQTAADPPEEARPVDGSAGWDDYPPVRSATCWCPAGCSERADSLVLTRVDSPQAGCSADSLPVDYSVVPAPAGSVAHEVDDSAVRDYLCPVVRSEPADCLGGSRVGWQAAWKICPVSQHSAGSSVGCPDYPWSVLPVCPEVPVSPLGGLPRRRLDEGSAPLVSPKAVQDALPELAAVSRTELAVEEVSLSRSPAGS
jgi:hypothetical protein